MLQSTNRFLALQYNSRLAKNRQEVVEKSRHERTKKCPSVFSEWSRSCLFFFVTPCNKNFGHKMVCKHDAQTTNKPESFLLP